jgi:hypothetical protein
LRKALAVHEYSDAVFASIDDDHVLHRVAGGNETEVYLSDDQRYVVKLKGELGGSLDQALAHARESRAASDAYASCLGSRHSIPNYYLIARDSAGQVQVLTIQPFLKGARPLSEIDYHYLTPAQRTRLSIELHDIIRRAERHFLRHGDLPDLYGRTSASSAERRRQKSPAMLPQRVWSFLVERTLLHSFNLMYDPSADRPVVLVDYDFVRRGRLYRLVYYLTRMVLFWRDRLAILAMRASGIGR